MAAAKETGKTDKQWHAHLMCKLSGKLGEDALKNLKQVISMAEEVPENEIEKCRDFFIFWKTLERLGKIRLGEYGILINYLEMLSRQDCVLVIEDHITKIEEYRQGQNLAKTSQASTCVERAPASAKINQQDGHGQTALTRAAEGFDIDDVRSLLKSGAYPDLPDVDGYTALMYASKEGYGEIADALIENHADVNLQNKVEDDSTALMYASCNGNKEIVAVLLENNVDVNLQDTFGKTALSYAKKEGHNKVVKMLMAAGARQ